MKKWRPGFIRLATLCLTALLLLPLFGGMGKADAANAEPESAQTSARGDAEKIETNYYTVTFTYNKTGKSWTYYSYGEVHTSKDPWGETRYYDEIKYNEILAKLGVPYDDSNTHKNYPLTDNSEYDNGWRLYSNDNSFVSCRFWTYPEEECKMYGWYIQFPEMLTQEQEGQYLFNVPNYHGAAGYDDDEKITVVAKAEREWTDFHAYGAGTSSQPFIIRTGQQLRSFHDYLEAGGGYYSSFSNSFLYRLDNDISQYTLPDSSTHPLDESCIIGSPEHPFCGFFDGAGHTLTYNIDTRDNGEISNCAPFGGIKCAYIYGLKVSGSISVAQIGSADAAGLVSVATGYNRITDCVVDMTVTNNSSPLETCGGVIGKVVNDGTWEGWTTAQLRGILFTGSLPNVVYGNGGIFCGKMEEGASLDVTDCLDLSASESEFCRAYESESITINNSYYMNASKQGYSVGSGVRAGRFVMDNLMFYREYFGGILARYDVSGIKADCGCLIYNGVYYAGVGKEVEIDLFTPDDCVGIMSAYSSLAIKNPASPEIRTYKAVADQIDTISAVTKSNFPLKGKGTEGDPYLIETTDDWEWLSRYVRCSNNTCAYYSQRNDIRIISMIGDLYSFPFLGIYDGGGHVLNIDLTSYTGNSIAPFARTYNATIKNLNVTGIVRGGSECSGLVVYATGELLVENCTVAATINTSIMCGGFVSRCGLEGSSGGYPHFDGVMNMNTAHLVGCRFSGSITEGLDAATFCGYSQGEQPIIEYCLDTSSCNYPFATGDYAPDGSVSRISHSFYTGPDKQCSGNRQWFYPGRKALAISPAEGVTISHRGSVTTYNVAGFTAAGGGICFGGVYYSGEGEAVPLSLTDQTSSVGANILVDYKASVGTMVRSGDAHAYTLTMGSGNAVISTLFSEAALSGGNGTPSAPYEIAAAADWHTLSAFQTAGGDVSCMYFRQTADISTTEMNGANAAAAPFNGSYDGGGHTLTVALTSTDDNARAPFRYLKDATIRNLKVRGSVSGGIHSAGFAAYTDGTILIEGCLVDVAVGTTGAYCGGVIGNGINSNATLRGVVFTGSLPAGKTAGVFWGWSGENAVCALKDCLDLSDSAYPLGLQSGGSVTNTFYTRAGKAAGNGSLWSNAGRLAYAAAGADGASLSLYESSSYYDILAVGTACLFFEGTLYMCEGQSANIILRFTSTQPGAGISGYSVSCGTLDRKSQYYTYTMGAGNAAVTPVWISKLLSVGSGTENDPYQVASADDWRILRQFVMDGNSTASMYFRQTADISTTMMLGTAEQPFRGVYNGDGHTLNVALDELVDHCAPFRFISDATIYALKVTGSVNGGNRSAGFVGYASGTNLLENCLIETSVTAVEMECSGVLGDCGKSATTLCGIKFSGSITGGAAKTTYYMGWCEVGSTPVLKDCFQYVCQGTKMLGMIEDYTVKPTYINTYANIRNANAESNVEHDFYDFRRICYIQPDENVTIDFFGEAVTYYSVSGITAYEPGLSCDGKFYAGHNLNDITETVTLTLKGRSTEPGLTVVGYYIAFRYGSLQRTMDVDSYRYAFEPYNSANETIVKAVLGEASFSGGSGAQTDPYRIASVDDWHLLSQFLWDGWDTTGVYFEQTADIKVYEMAGDDSDGVGAPFRGVYNGGGHTLEIELKSALNTRAPFRCIDGATIRNLKVAGSVSGTIHSAGLAAYAKGTNLIENCVVATEVKTSGTHCGGVIGHGLGSNTTMRGVVFSGSLPEGKTAGTFWGWSDPKAVCVLHSCLDLSDSTYPLGNGALASGSGVTNTYYTKSGKRPGTDSPWTAAKQALSVSGASGVTFGFGSGTTYNVSGVTAYKVGLGYNGTFYAGKGEKVALTLDGTGYTASSGTLKKTESGYTLTLGSESVVISKAQTYSVSGSFTGSDGKLTATVSAPDSANTLLIAAVYDKNGRQVDVKAIPLEAGKTEYATGLSKTAGYTCKLMLVDKTGYVPLCEAWESKAQ
ncbi:MAG: hypothetical protein E7425_11390 [Ruminococcaceae bacterium]|nr:hypothetical protein [Oscillospiraceae bacterium]